MKSCPIANHELYTITDKGEIYSGKLGIKLKPRKNTNGYLIVTLDKKQLSVHRLVALHFIPNPYNYPEINHKDGNKENNDITNLEWVSSEENKQHALKTGLRKGFVHVDIIRQMLHRALKGETAKDLAKEVGNHPNTLNRMMKRQAIRDGLLNEWEEECKRKRRITACKNLGKINVKN
jgi:hypothetical protein